MTSILAFARHQDGTLCQLLPSLERAHAWAEIVDGISSKPLTWEFHDVGTLSLNQAVAKLRL